MSQLIKNIVKAFDAGFLIGIATITYLQIENKYLGAFLFGIGLLVICCYQLKLCTGMFGYVFERADEDLIGATLGNVIGILTAFICIRVVNPNIVEAAHNVLLTKLDKSLPQMFLSGIFCGILIFLAVDIFSYGASSFTKALGIFTCVPVFVLNSFDHGVVTMFYVCAASTKMEVLQGILRVLIVLLGNFVGALVTCFAIRYVNFNNRKGDSNAASKT